MEEAFKKGKEIMEETFKKERNNGREGYFGGIGGLDPR